MNVIPPPAHEVEPYVPSGKVADSCDPAPPETTRATGQGEPGAADRSRRLPVGAELTPQGVDFRVWAPERRQVAVILAEGLEALAPFPLETEANGYFSGTVESARGGTLYWYRLDDEADLVPDPASRFQPEGPMGPSEVIDPDLFAWTDIDWPDVGPNG